MSGTIKRPAAPLTAARIPEPAANQLGLDTATASVPVHHDEMRDPRDTLTITSNLKSFLHRTGR
jgi:hypothetical protein